MVLPHMHRHMTTHTSELKETMLDPAAAPLPAEGAVLLRLARRASKSSAAPTSAGAGPFLSASIDVAVASIWRARAASAML